MREEVLSAPGGLLRLYPLQNILACEEAFVPTKANLPDLTIAEEALSPSLSR